MLAALSFSGWCVFLWVPTPQFSRLAYRYSVDCSFKKGQSHLFLQCLECCGFECCGIPMMRKHTADRWGYRGKHERTTRDMQEGDCRLKSVECTAENKLVMCQRQNGCDRDSVGRHKVPVSENQRWPAVKHLKHPQPDQLMIHKAGFGRLSHATYLFIYRVMFRVLKDILRELEWSQNTKHI